MVINKSDGVSRQSVSMPELWTNTVGWFNLCNISYSALTGISGNMKVYSELFGLKLGYVYLCEVASIYRAVLYLLN